MPVREVIPRTKRERTSNYGDTESTTGENRAPIFAWDAEQADFVQITAEVVEFTIPPNTTGNFRPYLRVAWGHGGTDVVAEFDITYRQRIPLVCSKVDVEIFIKSLEVQGTERLDPQPIPADAKLKVRAFVGEGVDGLPLVPTRWQTQFNSVQGILSAVSCRLANLRAFLTAATASPAYLLLFDANAAVANGAIPVDGMPLVTPPVGPVPLELGSTRGFVNGLVWAISSTPYMLTLDNAGRAFVSAEFEQ